MKTTTRYLVLLTACSLLSACTDEKVAKPKAEKTEITQSAQALAEPQLADPTTMLTAIADRPKTIADEPVLAAQPKAPAEPEKTALAAHGDEDPEPVDFDRPISASEVKIERFVLALDVAQREPVGETDTFSTDTKKIFAFVQLSNPDSAPYAFTVHWEKVDGPASPYGVKLNVPTAVRHRTWSWTAIERAPGTYRAVLRTLAGEEIASRELVITTGE